jgi:hypothetical protein
MVATPMAEGIVAPRLVPRAEHELVSLRVTLARARLTRYCGRHR